MRVACVGRPGHAEYPRGVFSASSARLSVVRACRMRRKVHNSGHFHPKPGGRGSPGPMLGTNPNTTRVSREQKLVEACQPAALQAGGRSSVYVPGGFESPRGAVEQGGLAG